MSKKKFADQFDQLFQEEGPVAEAPTADEQADDQLGQFLQRELADVADANKPIKKSKRSTSSRKSFAGLDVLIRSTSDTQPAPLPPPDRKRLTVVLPKAKLLKLKAIARDENLYLKDIIDELVGEYIERHDP